MEKIDLSIFSMSELKRLQGKIQTEIVRREDSVRRVLLKQMEKMASEEGYTLNDILGIELPENTDRPRRGRKPGSPNKLAGVKVPPKYRHPENADLEWTGRGRAPKWVEEWKANGGSLEGLLIADAE